MIATPTKKMSLAEQSIRYNLGRPLGEKYCIHYFTPKGVPYLGRVEDLPSMLIGGWPKHGKTSAMVFYACEIVQAGGQLLVIDPHYGAPRDSLGSMLLPLERWFLKPILNYNEVEPEQVKAYFKLIEDEFHARKRANGTKGKSVLLLMVDEWNELLECMPKDVHDYIVHVVSTTARAGRKYGLHLMLAGQQWQLNVSGGNSVRTNVQGRVTFNAEFSSIKLVLDSRDKAKLDSLVNAGLAPGFAIARLPFSDTNGIIRIRYPYYNRAACVNVATLLQKVQSENSTLLPAQSTDLQVFSDETGESEFLRPSTLNNTHIEPIKTFNPTTQIGVVDTLNFQTFLLENLNFSSKNLKITIEDLQQIIQLGTQQIQRTGKVKRGDIVEAMGGNTHTSRKVKAVCDFMGWNLSMGKDKIDPAIWQRIKEQYNFTCLKCGKREPDIELQPDRIVPNTKGGYYTYDNVQPLCKPCNSGKGDAIADYRKDMQS